MRICLFLIIIAAYVNPAVAQPLADNKCREILFKEDKIYEIKTALYKGTHIKLPEPLLFPPQPGDSDLWTIEGVGDHVMVQPNTDQPQGAKTNLTLITEGDTSYHFTLHRVPFEQGQTCVIIKKAKKFFEGPLNGAAYQTPCQTQLKDVQTLLSESEERSQQEIEVLKEELAAEKKLSGERINSIISKYRSMIYTRYKWSDGWGFKGRHLLSDVWDDGRFTFIRVMPDHRGALAVKAQVDGKEEMIEYTNDSENVYKITGIYPSFTLVYGDRNKVKITRKDNASNGGY